jgi:site-specific DNA-methyltransferase (adenine-specific)
LTPYYEQDGITIYHGDCREVLPLAVHAVVTDPPYGISDKAFNGGARGGQRVGGDNVWHPPSDWDHAIDPEWMRLVGMSAPLVAWFGHWRKREEVASGMPHPLRAEIVWAKNCHMGPPCPLAMRDERIWLFARDGINGHTFETSVWDEAIIPTWARKSHKNEKPVKLMRRLLRFLCGDARQAVADPFMGSGTTLLAARDLGHTAIGVEMEEAYCEIAAKRLEEARAQQSLPLEQPA